MAQLDIIRRKLFLVLLQYAAFHLGLHIRAEKHAVLLPGNPEHKRSVVQQIVFHGVHLFIPGIKHLHI